VLAESNGPRRPATNPSCCWHCGVGAGNNYGESAVIVKRGERMRVRLCHRCVTIQARWIGWHPASAEPAASNPAMLPPR
jgi:hypothetical protein